MEVQAASAPGMLKLEVRRRLRGDEQVRGGTNTVRAEFLTLAFMMYYKRKTQTNIFKL